VRTGVTTFLLRVVLNTVAIAIAPSFISGVQVDGILPALAGGALLAVVNAIIRPVLVILTLPITIFTLGLFILVVNGGCFWFVAWLIDGFRVSGFWPAVFGALLVSVVNWVAGALAGETKVVVTRHEG
jgi:putative membrane protein